MFRPEAWAARRDPFRATYRENPSVTAWCGKPVPAVRSLPGPLHAFSFAVAAGIPIKGWMARTAGGSYRVEPAFPI